MNKKQRYSSRYLQKALKEAGLAHSQPSIIRYENQGIIPIHKSPGGIRQYTQEQIEGIVNTLEEFYADQNHTNITFNG